MAISFDQIPVDLRTPLFYAEVNNDRAAGGEASLRALLIGQQIGSGSENLQLVPDAQWASKRFGAGSMIARQVAAFKANNDWQELWVVPLQDSSAGGAASAAGTITFSGTVAAAGTVYLYIAGQRVAVPIPAKSLSGAATTAAEVAAIVRGYVMKQRASVDVLNELPVTLAVSGAVITFTAKNKGTVGNTIDLRLNYAGGAAGETLPSGISASIVAMTGGLSDPDVSTALTKIGDEPFEYWCTPYTDPTSLGLLKSAMESRWGPLKQLYGHVFAAKDATYSTLVTLGDTLNDPHLTLFGYNDSPTWTPEYAAAITGVAAFNLTNDPARTLQTLRLNGVYPPALAKRFTVPEADILLHHGIATTYANVDEVRIQRAITTYQVNELGSDDASYLDVTTLCTLARIIRETKNLVLNRFPRYKLAKDGTSFGAGQAIVTPSIVRAELIALYRRMIRRGLVQNEDRFIRQLRVELNADDPNRLDVRLPPTLINNLIVFATQVQFQLVA
jgi:phage tail sheath gpL-like